MELGGQDNLGKVVEMFKQYNCSEQSLISKKRLTDILNKQANLHLNRNFSPNIIEQFWGQAETTSRGESTVFTFSKIYSQAMTILEDRIRVINSPSGLPQKQQQLIAEKKKLMDLEAQYDQGLTQNYDKINVVRKNIGAIENKIEQLNKNKGEFQRDLYQMKGCLQVEQKPHPIEKSHYIEAVLDQTISPPAPSPHLRLIFIVTVISALLQTLLLYFHESFLALFCYLMIIYWLFLGYYDQHFVKYIMIGLGLSCVLDLTYICLEMIGRLGNNRFFSSQKTFIFVGLIILIIQIAMRLLLIIKMCSFREPNAKRQSFMLFGNEIELNNRSGKMFSSQRD